MKRFGLKERKDYSKDLITKEQYKKIKEFKERNDIVVRKADKNNTFVIMNNQQYIDKLNLLISDGTKFSKVNKDPSNELKTQLNKLIAKANLVRKTISTIEGHHEPGYIYGNPKTHKSEADPPLRPITSQVGTVTYDTAKRLNSIIAKYMPKQFMIESTFEFIEIARTVNCPKMLASLDVESLFTNVPLLTTIDTVSYTHLTLPTNREV